MTRYVSLGCALLTAAALGAAVNGLHAQESPGAKPSEATAYKFEDIAGKWCTAAGSEQFDRENLIAVVAGTSERRVYPIVSYEYTDDKIRVTWKDKTGDAHSDYAEFSRDGRKMVQLQNTKGPRREFHRC
jgi:hypothetical protein